MKKKRPWKSKKVDWVEVSRILSNLQEQPRQLWDQILLYWHSYLIEVFVFLAFRDEEDGLVIISCKYQGPCLNTDWKPSFVNIVNLQFVSQNLTTLVYDISLCDLENLWSQWGYYDSLSIPMTNFAVEYL